jgi:nucleoside-diphosphate-sugar epimerase
VKVLVVGGAGYVGGWLTDEAVRAGHTVRVFDKLLYEDTYLKDVDFCFGDILDQASLLPNLKWADCVIFLAGFVGDPACALNPDLTMQTNVKSVEFLVKNFGGRIIFPSTCSVYGAQLGELTEESPTSPLSLYAESKLIAEEILLSSNRSSLIFRLGTLFGLSDTYARLRVDLVLNVLTIRAVLEGRMSVFGGQQYRPLLHVRDVATAMIPHVGTDVSGLFNLHCVNTTIIELANQIQQIVPESTIEVTSSSFQDARNYMVSSAKAKNMLGFVPKHNIADGIREVANVVGTRRITDVNLPRFSKVAALSAQGVRS